MKKEKADLAFELYTSLGEKRSYEKVANLMGLSVQSIRKVGTEEKWQERLNLEYKEKSGVIKQKREQLEELGFEVALNALCKIKEKIDTGVINTDLAKIYEMFLKCPFSVNNGNSQNVDIQPACAASNEENIEDTVETKSVLEQIEVSLNALDGDTDG